MPDKKKKNLESSVVMGGTLAGQKASTGQQQFASDKILEVTFKYVK